MKKEEKKEWSSKYSTLPGQLYTGKAHLLSLVYVLNPSPNKDQIHSNCRFIEFYSSDR